jgi:predicted nucleotidyltransferase
MSEEAKIQWPDVPFDISATMLLAGRRGSEAHGTYVPPADPNGIDDRDIMGIIVQPEAGYLGLGHWEEAQSIKGVWDVVLYDARKFVRLLAKANPNVVGMLWLREEDYIHRTPAGDMLIAERETFHSKDAFYASLIGYARSQLHRMTSGQGHPKRGFMGAKRKLLVDRYGYDVKNAAHLIRLLHMGVEYLKTGRMNVFRTWDAQMLKDIKTGKWALADVNRYAEKQFAVAEEAYRASDLPAELDQARAEALLVKIVKEFWA